MDGTLSAQAPRQRLTKAADYRVAPSLFKRLAVRAFGLTRDDARVQEPKDLEDQLAQVGEAFARDSGAEPQRVPALGDALRKWGEAPIEEVERLGDCNRVG